MSVTEAEWRSLQQEAAADGYPWLIVHARLRGITYEKAIQLLAFARMLSDTDEEDDDAG